MVINKNISISDAKNIGPTIAKRLKGVGIYTLADLAETTPIGAYKQMAKEAKGKHLPLCYYLYSLQGAIMDVHWDDIPSDLKNELKNGVEN